jgi:FkbM family methyltransferase
MSLKEIIRAKFPSMFRLMRWLYRLPKNYWKPPEGDAGCILERFCRNLSRPLTFVQVGANDGNDEFASLRRRYHWSGVMVEPQKRVYDQLVQSNSEPGIAFEMAAIADQDGARTLYEISFSKAQWATALASFDYNVIEKHIKDGYIASCAMKEGVSLPSRVEDYCIRESVQCITLKSLGERHHLDSLDILLVDTEGYDYEIVRQIPQLHDPPKVVLFEHKHLSKSNYLACIQMLRALKYDLHADGCNCIGVRK